MAKVNDLSESFSDLSNTITTVSGQQLQGALGLARLAGERRVQDADLAIKGIEREKAQIALDEIKRTVNELNQPVTLQQTIEAFAGNSPQELQDPRTLSTAIDVMKTWGWKIDEANPDPNQLLLNKDGNPITKRDLVKQAPMIGSYIAGNVDVLPVLSNRAGQLKQSLGATSAGPWLSDQELSTLVKDSSKKELLAQYNQLKSDYIRYSEEPSILYREQLNKLDNVAAYIKSIGGDTSLIDTRRKELSTVIAQKDKQSEERQYKVSKKAAGLLGLNEGERVSEKVFENINTAESGILQQGIAAGAQVQSAKISAGAHIAAAKISAGTHLQAVREQVAQGKIMAAQQSWTQHMNIDIPKMAMENFDKTHSKDAMGNYIGKDGRPLSQDQIQTEQSKTITKLQLRAYQDAQDNGLLKTLQLNPPAGIFKAPPNIRQNIATMDQTIAGQLPKVKDQGFLQVINGTRQRASELLKTDDPKNWDAARGLMGQATLQLESYFKIKKQDIPKNIKNTVRDMSNKGLGNSASYSFDY